MFGLSFNNLVEYKIISTPVGNIQIFIEEDHNDFLEIFNALACTGLIWNGITYKQSVVFYRPFVESLTNAEIEFVMQHEVGHLVHDHALSRSSGIHNTYIEIVADMYALKQTGYNGGKCLKQIMDSVLAKIECPKKLVRMANIEVLVRATVLNVVELIIKITRLF